MKKVVIIQRGISKHRIAFYEKLKRDLEANNIQLYLIQGHFGKHDSIKKDFDTIQWAIVIKNRIFRIFGKELYWQPALKYVLDADLVIVEQANRLLLNYMLLILRKIYKFKLALWGHGRNFQAFNPNSLLEQFKRIYTIKADWWFAYNDLSAKQIKLLGYPEDKITSVQNAIDTRRLIAAQKATTPKTLEQIREELSIRGENICIYTGGLYPGKRLDFLLDACIQVKKEVTDFEIIFIGSGPEENRIKKAANDFPWIHFTGPKFDEMKVPYFMLSKLFLMPSLVGLAILDAFAMGTPLITTSAHGHGPEIDYLIEDINGVIVKESNDSSVYAAHISHILKTDTVRENLTAGCRASREKYTIENMANRFTTGVIRALNK